MTTSTLGNVKSSMTLAIKFAAVVVLIGLVLTHYNSPVFLGIVFISATFLLYTKVIAGGVLLVSFITSIFSSRSKVVVVPETEENLKENIMSAMNNMTQEQLMQMMAVLVQQAEANKPTEGK